MACPKYVVWSPVINPALQCLTDGLIFQPEHLKSSKLGDYFDLTFAALPHKVLTPEKFEEAVVDLRKRFTDRERDDFVFKPAYHKRIPADGVGFYLDGIWVSAV